MPCLLLPASRAPMRSAAKIPSSAPRQYWIAQRCRQYILLPGARNSGVIRCRECGPFFWGAWRCPGWRLRPVRPGSRGPRGRRGSMPPSTACLTGAACGCSPAARAGAVAKLKSRASKKVARRAGIGSDLRAWRAGMVWRIIGAWQPSRPIGLSARSGVSNSPYQAPARCVNAPRRIPLIEFLGVLDSIPVIATPASRLIPVSVLIREASRDAWYQRNRTRKIGGGG